MSFEKISGQASVIQALQGALAKGRLAHGLLFTGPQGPDLRIAALETAKALLCRREGKNGGCDDCRDCDAGGGRGDECPAGERTGEF